MEWEKGREKEEEGRRERDKERIIKFNREAGGRKNKCRGRR